MNSFVAEIRASAPARMSSSSYQWLALAEMVHWIAAENKQRPRQQDVSALIEMLSDTLRRDLLDPSVGNGAVEQALMSWAVVTAMANENAANRVRLREMSAGTTRSIVTRKIADLFMAMGRAVMGRGRNPVVMGKAVEFDAIHAFAQVSEHKWAVQQPFTGDPKGTKRPTLHQINALNANPGLALGAARAYTGTVDVHSVRDEERLLFELPRTTGTTFAGFTVDLILSSFHLSKDDIHPTAAQVATTLACAMVLTLEVLSYPTSWSAYMRMGDAAPDIKACYVLVMMLRLCWQMHLSDYEEPPLFDYMVRTDAARGQDGMREVMQAFNAHFLQSTVLNDHFCTLLTRVERQPLFQPLATFIYSYVGPFAKLFEIKEEK